jgi:hypothetical protein
MIRTYPHAPQLEGARAKVQQAQVHAALIRREVLRVTGADAYSVVLRTENDGRKHLWRIEGLQSFDDRLPLWIGDCMHNFRSAWDHIAHELIKAVPGLESTNRTMYPLLADEPAGPLYILPNPGPHSEAMRIVEESQPYNAGHGSDPLSILNHLDIVDKHRELLALAASVEVPYYGSPSGVNTVESWAWGGAVSDGDTVMWAVIDSAQPEGALDGHVILTTKLAEDILPMPLHMALSIENLIDDIAGQLTWRLAEFDWYFATH